jgi:hypothetical protein
MFHRIIVIFQIFLVCASGVFAQQKPDSANVPVVFKKIEDFSSKRKFTSLAVGLILRPVNATSPQSLPTTRDLVQESFINYEGKIIRRINITTLDPFGFSIFDTTAKPHSFIEKSGNTLHVKTLHFTIRNQLLIHRNDRFNTLLVKESERLIRSQSYIHDVFITAQPVGINCDSVDIFIRVIDLWSIVPDGSLSSTRVRVILTERNLAGLGHTFSNSFTQNYVNGNNAFSTSYYIPNIKNSFINIGLSYAIDENKNYYKSLDIERTFFSPCTRWAGGVYLSQQKLPQMVFRDDTSRLLLTSTFNIQDYWAAMAWQVFKGITEAERTTKLILSGRILNIRYLEKPPEYSELHDYYDDERFFLSGIGISSRKYMRQYYIFRFGVPEDVPIGYAFGLVGGYQLKNRERWYWGIQHTRETAFSWGIFGYHFEYGTFMNASVPTQQVIIASANYFSRLFSIRKWRFRQFFKTQLMIGLDQNSYNRLTLNDGNGLNGFQSDVLSGTRRLLFVIQTQSYAPWNVIGFRFGPYLNCSFGMLGNEASGFRYSRMYPQLGMGILIRNDFLVVSRIELSFAYYPTIPGKGNNVFKTNPFRSDDFGFTDLIIGKPETVEFH